MLREADLHLPKAGWGRIVDVVNVVFSLIFFHEVWEWGRGEVDGVDAGSIKVGAGVRWVWNE